MGTRLGKMASASNEQFEIREYGNWTEPFFPKYDYYIIKAFNEPRNRTCGMCNYYSADKLYLVKNRTTMRVMRVDSICCKIMCEEQYWLPRFKITPSAEASRFVSAVWYKSNTGRHYIYVECNGCYFKVTISQSRDSNGYSPLITELHDDEVSVKTWEREWDWYDDQDEAKIAAFEWLKAKAFEENQSEEYDEEDEEDEEDDNDEENYGNQYSGSNYYGNQYSGSNYYGNQYDDDSSRFFI